MASFGVCRRLKSRYQIACLCAAFSATNPFQTTWQLAKCSYRPISASLKIKKQLFTTRAKVNYAQHQHSSVGLEVKNCLFHAPPT